MEIELMEIQDDGNAVLKLSISEFVNYKIVLSKHISFEFVNYKIVLSKHISLEKKVFAELKETKIMNGLDKVGDKNKVGVLNVIGGSNLKNGLNKNLDMSFEVSEDCETISEFRIFELIKGGK